MSRSVNDAMACTDGGQSSRRLASTETVCMCAIRMEMVETHRVIASSYFWISRM